MPTPSQPKAKPVISFVWTPTFPEPRDMDEARFRREHLLAEIREIDGQLANPTRMGSDGQPMELKEYRAWRGRAIAAAQTKRNNARLLGLWIEGFRPVRGSASPSSASPAASSHPTPPSQAEVQILGETVALFDRLVSEDVEFDRDELHLIQRLQALYDALTATPNPGGKT